MPTSQQVLPAEVKTILSASGPVGGAVSALTGVLEALGLQIKGKTQHLSYDQVNPAAQAFSRDCFGAFARGYTVSEMQSIAQQVKPLFLASMTANWGLGASLNQTIARDIAENAGIQSALARQLWLYGVWIGTNVDAESTTSYSEYMLALFPQIFLQAIANAGLSISKLKGSTAVPVLPPSETNPDVETEVSPTRSSFNVIGILAIVGALGYMFVKKGGK